MIKIFCDSCEKEITNEKRGTIMVSAHIIGEYVVCFDCAEKIMKLCGDSINKKKQEANERRNNAPSIGQVIPSNGWFQSGAVIGQSIESSITPNQIHQTQRTVGR